MGEEFQCHCWEWCPCDDGFKKLKDLLKQAEAKIVRLEKK